MKFILQKVFVDGKEDKYRTKYIDTEWCCESARLLSDMRFNKEEHPSLYIEHDNGEGENREISYCPFCGKKIEYSYIEPKRLRTVTKKHTITQTEIVEE